MKDKGRRQQGRAYIRDDIERVRPELDAITRIIVNTVPVEAIYLFGSYAYGTPHQDSDLDLYVVLKNEAPLRNGETIDAMRIAIYREQIHPIDLLALKQSRFLHLSSGSVTIEHEVVQKGLKLYG